MTQKGMLILLAIDYCELDGEDWQINDAGMNAHDYGDSRNIDLPAHICIYEPDNFPFVGVLPDLRLKNESGERRDIYFI